MSHEQRPTVGVRLWLGLYRALLRLLPRTLRERHGGAMRDLFARDLARAEQGAHARLAVGLAGLGDLLGRAAQERLAAERRAFGPAQRAVLRQTALGFAVGGTALTAMFVSLAVWRQRDHGLPCRPRVSCSRCSRWALAASCRPLEDAHGAFRAT
jgi:hypothetical protein